MSSTAQSGQLIQTTADNGQAITPGYARYMLFVLVIVFMVHNVDRQIISILLVPIQNELQVSDTAMGLLTGFAFATAYALAGIPLAHLCDRGNRRNILSTVIAVWSGFTAICGLVTSYTQLLLARVGVAFGEAGGHPSCVSLISDLFPAAKRGRAMGIFFCGASAGVFVGIWLGGWINEAMGWRMAFIAVGLPGLLLALIVRLTLKEPKRGAVDNVKINTEEKPHFPTVFKYLWSLKTYRFLMLGNALHSVAIYACFAWAPTFFIRAHGWNTAQVGLWIGLMAGAGAICGNLLGGTLTDVLGRRSKAWYMGVAGLALFLAMPFAALFLLLEHSSIAVFFYFPVLLCIATPMAPMAVVTQGIVKPRMRAMSYTFQYMVTSLVGMGSGPFLVGLINDMLRPQFGELAVRYSLLGVVGVGALFSGMAFLNASRTVAAEMEQAQS